MDELQCALVAERTRHVYRCVAMPVGLLFYFYFFKLYLPQVLLV